MTNVKTCTKCKETKATTEFCKNSGQKSGLHPSCKKCQSAASKAYYAATKEARKGKHKAYRDANKEAISSYAKAWADANKERVVANNKAWYKANIEHVKSTRKSRYHTNKESYTNTIKAWKKNNPLKQAAITGKANAVQRAPDLYHLTSTLMPQSLSMLNASA